MSNDQGTQDDIRGDLRMLASITNELLYLADVIARTATYAPTIYGCGVNLWFGDKDGMAECARAIRRHFSVEHTDKDASGDTFRMEMTIPGTSYYFSLQTSRSNVCTRIDTGRTETKMVADYSHVPKIEKVVPVIEWKCDPILDS